MDRAEFNCGLCEDRDVCQAPCEWMRRRLPKAPHLRRQRPAGLWPARALLGRWTPADPHALRRYRALLTAGEWAALDLTYREGLSQRQVARRIGCSRSTVQVWVNRARAKLRRHVIQK